MPPNLRSRQQSSVEPQPTPSKPATAKKSRAASTTAGGTKNKRLTAILKAKQEQEQGDGLNDFDRISEEPETNPETVVTSPNTLQPEKLGEAAENSAYIDHLDQYLDNGKTTGRAARDHNGRPSISSLPDLSTLPNRLPGSVDALGPFQKLGKHFDNFASVLETADAIRDVATKVQQDHSVLADYVKDLNAHMDAMHNAADDVQLDIAKMSKFLVNMKREFIGPRRSSLPVLQPVTQFSAARKRSHPDGSPEHDDAEDQEGGRSPLKRSMVNPSETSKRIKINSSSPLTDAPTSFLNRLQNPFSSTPQDEDLGNTCPPDEDVASEDSAATRDAEDTGSGSVVVVQSFEEGQEVDSPKA